MITSPSTGVEIVLPGRQDNILFSGAPDLIVTLFPPLISTTGIYSSVNELKYILYPISARVGRESSVGGDERDRTVDVREC